MVADTDISQRVDVRACRQLREALERIEGDLELAKALLAVLLRHPPENKETGDSDE